MNNLIKNSDYKVLLVEIKAHIRSAQQKAVALVNTQMLSLYFSIGEAISQKQQELGWGSKVIQKIAIDIKNELPAVKGFSQRNIKLMVQFYHEYQGLEIGQMAAAQSNIANGQPLVAQIPWSHNVLLMQKIKDRNLREWYMGKTLEHGWSKAVLAHMIFLFPCFSVETHAGVKEA